MSRTLLRQRPSKIIWFYLAVEFFISFAVAFSFFFFIFFVNQLLLLAEDILVKNISFISVLKLIIYSTPTIISLSTPFGSLVGCLMAVGRLSSESEMISLRAMGFKLSSIFAPFCIIGAILSLLSFIVNDYFLPLGTIKFIDLYREILFSHPELELEPYSVTSYQNDVIITDDISGGSIQRLLIIGKDAEGNKRLIISNAGQLQNTSPDSGIIALELNNTFIHSIDASDPAKYWTSTSESMYYNILLENITMSVRELGPRELSARDLYTPMKKLEDEYEQDKVKFYGSVQSQKIRLGLEYMYNRSSTEKAAILTQNISKKSTPLRPFLLQLYRIEFFKKFALPFAAFCFIFFAFPAGLFSHRSGKSVSFGVGLFVSVLYWSVLIAGQTIGTNNSTWPAFWSVWAANFLVLGVGLIIFIRRFRQ